MEVLALVLGCVLIWIGAFGAGKVEEAAGVRVPRADKKARWRAFVLGTALVLLVLDAGLGQNALRQAEQFHRAIGVTGIVVTKLDGTAKGGIVIAIAQRFGLPIRFVGVGEQAEDFGIFNAGAYVDGLLRTTPGTVQ